MSTPGEPDDKLRYGLRLIETAYDEKTRALDQELQNLRSFSQERQAQVTALERRVSELEMQLRDSEQKGQQHQAEKNHVAQQMNAMQRDMGKLDQFKRSIMQSIHDDDPAPPDHSRFRASAAYEHERNPAPRAFIPSASPPHPTSTSPPVPVASVPRYMGGSASAASSPLAAYAPSGVVQGPGQGLGQGAPPPPGSGSVHLDGKDFFRQARLRLTYEQFNQFLSNIKRLNDHAQSREDTLLRAQEIFGAENQDLFVAFKNLLTKHGLT